MTGGGPAASSAASRPTAASVEAPPPASPGSTPASGTSTPPCPPMPVVLVVSFEPPTDDVLEIDALPPAPPMPLLPPGPAVVESLRLPPTPSRLPEHAPTRRVTHAERSAARSTKPRTVSVQRFTFPSSERNRNRRRFCSKQMILLTVHRYRAAVGGRVAGGPLARAPAIHVRGAVAGVAGHREHADVGHHLIAAHVAAARFAAPGTIAVLGTHHVTAQRRAWIAHHARHIAPAFEVRDAGDLVDRLLGEPHVAVRAGGDARGVGVRRGNRILGHAAVGR